MTRSESGDARSSTVGHRSEERTENGIAETDAFWRAANYLAAAQIFLRANTLLKEPLQAAHIKPRLLGHWGTCPGLNFIYAHLNRAIRLRDFQALFIAGPGHGGAAVNACAFLEGAYHRAYPSYPEGAAGIEKLVTSFSWPGGSSSHVSPYTPGSIHEGGELGYCLAHAFGAAFDNPELLVCCVIGDGEAETGPLAASWHGNKFLNPQRDGAVLPILHLNGYKIASPTLLASQSDVELRRYFAGAGYDLILVAGDDPAEMHARMAAAIDAALASIASIQENARRNRDPRRPGWPLIALRSPKGWTGPSQREGEPVEGSFRSHQVPLPDAAECADDFRALEKWLRSYRPETLFGPDGTLAPVVSRSLPRPHRRMSHSPHANGGTLLRDLDLPRWQEHAIAVPEPGSIKANPAGQLGEFLRGVMERNRDRFRLFSPDEAESNRMGAVLDVTDRCWLGSSAEGDHSLGPDGRVIEVLSEHLCQGWLEGYLLTGRHGIFASYEAFAHIVDSMLNQHAKWLKVAKETGWRQPVASLNYLLASHVWQQDHNGFTHQDPGFLDHVANKKAELARIYLPPDANTLLPVADHCLRSRNRINVIVAGKKETPCWFDAAQAKRICAEGLDTLAWASSYDGADPEIVLVGAGDVPVFEVIAAGQILKRRAPIRFRVVCVVDLLCLQSQSHHPHGISDLAFKRHFTSDRPILFAFHGFPWLIHRLIYDRPNHSYTRVRGYCEEGSTTTPFDMRTRNRIDRYSLLRDVTRILSDHPRSEDLDSFAQSMLSRHNEYIRREGKDMPETHSWRFEQDDQ